MEKYVKEPKLFCNLDCGTLKKLLINIKDSPQNMVFVLHLFQVILMDHILFTFGAIRLKMLLDMTERRL